MPVRVQSNATTKRKPVNQPPAGPSGLPFNLPAPTPGQTQLPVGVSLCMIVRNEEQYLEQCLRSAAPFVDEICIVDTGSTDRTVEIARSFGARVEFREWRDDFAWARNEAIRMAAKRWIFMLDADEELDAVSSESLRRIGALPADKTGLYVRCNNLSDDYKGTGAISHLIVRVFPNNPRVSFISPVHEYVTYDNAPMGIDTRLSDITITHHGYLKGVVADRNKAERNFAIIRRAAELHPEDAFHWYNLGMTAHVVKDLEEAIMAFEKMRALLKGEARAFLPQALITLAECYSDARNDEERALEILREAQAASPQLTNVHFSFGRVYSKMGKRDEARQAFLTAIETEKYRHNQFIVDDQIYMWKAQHSLGVSYAEEKRWEEAIAWYDRGLANQPDVQPLHVNKAWALEGAGRYEEAEVAFAALYEKFQDETSIVQYINYLLRRRKEDLALELMEEHAEKVAPRTAATFKIAVAQMAHRVQNTERELASLIAANKRCPEAGPVLDALEAFYRAHRNEAALAALYEDELKYHPVEIPDFVRRSFRLIAMNRFEESLSVAQTGLAKAPADPELRYNAAVARVRLGQNVAALSDLRVILKDDTEISKKAALLSAQLLCEDGKFHEAIGALETIFNDDSVDAGVIRAKSLEGLGRVDEAISVLDRAAHFDRQRVGIEIASIYMRAGRFDEAQRAAERALMQ